MDNECSVNEVEQRLKEAGEQLAFPPSSTKDLLDLLDKIEQLLTCVGQAPSISMQGALVPSMGALIGDELLKHSEIDVRVAVASCLCEIARITAPEPPYKDETMKEIFQLNVTAFGELSNVTGYTYRKAIHILESVAKVKSCLLMLDLECDDLVLEMFEQFLSKVRSNHPQVFSDMETIMTLVIDESDEIAPELLSLLISHVRKENQNESPASWDLAEKVLRNCNNTLKSYSEIIMELIDSAPNDYAEVVTLLCRNANQNKPTATKSTKRGHSSMENGGSTKKQKSVDTQKRLKGNELETSKRGRPKKKKNNLNQDITPKSIQNSSSKKQSTKTKGNTETRSLYDIVIKKEHEILSDNDGVSEPLMQQMNNKVQNRRKPSSKKRVANGSSVKDIVKKWGHDLVGHNIKVWWPLDKMFYDGAVSSYDPINDKYKVLYADGDEELLDLYHEKWRMLDKTSHDQHHQVAELPTRKKQKVKKMLEENSNSPKSLPPADSSKTEPTKSANTSNTNINIPCNVDNHKDDPVQTPDISSEPKLTEKTIDSVEQDSELNQRVEPEETTQILEKNDESACEISDHITA